MIHIPCHNEMNRVSIPTDAQYYELVCIDIVTVKIFLMLCDY